jgi:hypothetical protein
MRCEDFPCCGHYEASTGDIFCHEANRSSSERARDEENLRHREALAAIAKREEYDASPETCEEYFALNPNGAIMQWYAHDRDFLPGMAETYEALDATPTYAELLKFYKQDTVEVYCGKCQSCIAENEEHDWERERYERDSYDY